MVGLKTGTVFYPYQSGRKIVNLPPYFGKYVLDFIVKVMKPSLEPIRLFDPIVLSKISVVTSPS